MKKIYVIMFALWVLTTRFSDIYAQQITLSSLLDEMVSFDSDTRMSAVPYTCRQVSSHDRRSVSPELPGWFANDDGFGVERVDTVDGRIEKVMFDCQGPGVITRIWLTTLDKRGTMRFYFNGSDIPGWTVPAYDLMAFGVDGLGRGMLLPHTSYEPGGRGGNTMFLPIPYSQRCKITFEDERGVAPTPKYYGINYRTYPAGTTVETFSNAVVANLNGKIAHTDSLLRNPQTVWGKTAKKKTYTVFPHSQTTLKLPKGNKAVKQMRMKVYADSVVYAQAMRNLVICAVFDGNKTVEVPLSDFSGAGMGAFPVKSWYLQADGKGEVVSRWLMPYSHDAVISLRNVGDFSIKASLEVSVDDYRWDEHSMYFYASWRNEDGIKLSNDYGRNDNTDWLFAHISGEGVYKGDVMTLYNHSPRWYGEGDEKIWVDKETFPSHFGTGTEDYYNSSWAPVYVFHTPFGGAPRADEHSSHGYNTFFRTRNLDGIPFGSELRFDLEMLSWDPGEVDMSVTVFWYGRSGCTAIGTTPVEKSAKPLLKP